tara:strand:- start:1476 stop:2132 length:657 start_codon:yes stop_codon:yes gene_type:complete
MYREIITDLRKSPLGITNNIWLWENINKDIDFAELNKFLLELEKELLQKPPLNTGGTGVKGVTSRFKYYNLFFKEHPELKKIENFILENIKSFLKYKNIHQNKIYTQCWFNVLREGEEIKIHQHRTINDFHLSFISGNFCTTNNDTKTYYTSFNNEQGFGICNEEGKLTLFPSYSPHFTTINKSKKERISIAFDVYPDISFIDPSYIEGGIIKQSMLL